MHRNTLIAAIIGTAALISPTTGALARGWIEKVDLTRDGIDAKPVEVGANASGYTGILTKNHRYLLRLNASAISGKRIVALKLGSYMGVLYFESSGDLWNKTYQARDVGSGLKRTVSINDEPVIPLASVAWHGSDPKQRCELKLQEEMSKGEPKANVLSREWYTVAYVHFELDAVAARKNSAKNNSWGIGNAPDQRNDYDYEVPVKCHAGISMTPDRVLAPEPPRKPGFVAPDAPEPPQAPRARYGG